MGNRDKKASDKPHVQKRNLGDKLKTYLDNADPAQFSAGAWTDKVWVTIHGDGKATTGGSFSTQIFWRKDKSVYLVRTLWKALDTGSVVLFEEPVLEPWEMTQVKQAMLRGYETFKQKGLIG